VIPTYSPTAILALDIDGVFHPEGCPADVEWAHRYRFEEAIREVPNVSIVISSARRGFCTLDELRAHFSPDIASRIIAVTPDLYEPGLQYVRGLRQLEIETWVAENAHGVPWLALDDRKGLFHEGCPNVLLVPHADVGGIGLQFEHLEELVSRLKAMTSTPRAAQQNKNPLTPLGTKRSYVIVVAVSRDGQHFVQLEKDRGPAHLIGKRTFPGGQIEVFDETPQHAAQRESREEFGLDFRRDAFEAVGLDSTPERDLHLVFVAGDISGAKTMESEKVSVESIDQAYELSTGIHSELYVSDFADILNRLRPRIDALRARAASLDVESAPSTIHRRPRI